MKIDTYPVGWLAALIRLRQAYASTVPAAERDRIRAHGRAGIRSQLRANARQIRLRQWRWLS